MNQFYDAGQERKPGYTHQKRGAAENMTQRLASKQPGCGFLDQATRPVRRKWEEDREQNQESPAQSK